MNTNYLLIGCILFVAIYLLWPQSKISTKLEETQDSDDDEQIFINPINQNHDTGI